MQLEMNGISHGDNVKEKAQQVFEKNNIFTKDELLTSLEYYIEFLQEDEDLTENSRKAKMDLFKRFLSVVNKCRLPDLAPESWRCYQYNLVGDGIVLELCTVEKFEGHDDEQDFITSSDTKELLAAKSEFVNVEDFARIQEVKVETVMRWINAGKLSDAVLDGDTWLIPSDHDKPQRGQNSSYYLVEPGLHLEEFPFVQFSENIDICRDDNDKSIYLCTFSDYKNDFREEMVLSKKDAERLKFLLAASGKAKPNGHIQFSPCIK